MVDDKTDLATPVTVNENGKNVRLVTVGDKWSYLQRSKFAANSQPYYYDENVEKFGEWLGRGIKNYSDGK